MPSLSEDALPEAADGAERAGPRPLGRPRPADPARRGRGARPGAGDGPRVSRAGGGAADARADLLLSSGDDRLDDLAVPPDRRTDGREPARRAAHIRGDR